MANNHGKSIRGRRGPLPTAEKIHTRRRTTPPCDRPQRGEQARIAPHRHGRGRLPSALPARQTGPWNKSLNSRPCLSARQIRVVLPRPLYHARARRRPPRSPRLPALRSADQRSRLQISWQTLAANCGTYRSRLRRCIREWPRRKGYKHRASDRYQQTPLVFAATLASRRAISESLQPRRDRL